MLCLFYGPSGNDSPLAIIGSVLDVSQLPLIGAFLDAIGDHLVIGVSHPNLEHWNAHVVGGNFPLLCNKNFNKLFSRNYTCPW